MAYLIPPKREHRTFNLIAPTHVLSAAMIALPQLSSRHCYSVPAVAPPLLALAHTTAICGLWNMLVCTPLPTVPRYFPPASFPSQRCLCHSDGPRGHAMVWPRRLDGRGVGGSSGGGCVGVGGLLYLSTPSSTSLHSLWGQKNVQWSNSFFICYFLCPSNHLQTADRRYLHISPVCTAILSPTVTENDKSSGCLCVILITSYSPRSLSYQSPTNHIILWVL